LTYWFKQGSDALHHCLNFGGFTSSCRLATRTVATKKSHRSRSFPQPWPARVPRPSTLMLPSGILTLWTDVCRWFPRNRYLPGRGSSMPASCWRRQEDSCGPPVSASSSARTLGLTPHEQKASSCKERSPMSRMGIMGSLRRIAFIPGFFCLCHAISFHLSPLYRGKTEVAPMPRT